MVTKVNLKPPNKSDEYRWVRDTKEEICALLGAPPLGDKCNVTLTHRSMSQLAQMMEEYEKKFFPRFDRSFTAWLRNIQYGSQGVEYDSCWHRLGGKGKVCRVQSSIPADYAQRPCFIECERDHCADGCCEADFDDRQKRSERTERGHREGTKRGSRPPKQE